MVLLATRVYDNGLTVLDTEANVLHICSAEPTTYTEVAGVSLGTKTSLSVGAPAAGTPDGRSVTIAAFTDGNVAASGNAEFYAIVDTVNSRLLVVQELAAIYPVTMGNTFSMNAFTVRMPAAI